MYPAPFNYHRPGSLEESIALLSSLGTGAKALAGGQSLIPILKMRMDEPSDLVDIRRLPELNFIRNEAGLVRIGALSTHAVIARSDIAGLMPVIRDCAGGIADPQVRSLGTIGGSVCVADPSSDWPTLLHILNAGIVCQGPGGSRTIPIREFIVDSYTTVLDDAELVTEIRFHVAPANSGGSYIGFKKAAPAYPAASVGIQLTLAEGDICRDIRLALGSAGPKTVVSSEAESQLRGKPLTAANLKKAADIIIEAAAPPSDSRGSTEFKRTVLKSLFMKAADIAIRRCRGTQISGVHDYV